MALFFKRSQSTSTLESPAMPMSVLNENFVCPLFCPESHPIQLSSQIKPKPVLSTSNDTLMGLLEDIETKVFILQNEKKFKETRRATY
jgi:hypothetical protein